MLHANDMIELAKSKNIHCAEQAIDCRIEEMAKAGGTSVTISLSDQFFLNEAMCNHNTLYRYLKENQERYEENGFRVAWGSQYNETYVNFSWKEE